jgi:hypothetical protein
MFKWKIGKKRPSKTLLQKRSLPESSRRSRGSVKNKKPSQGGRQQHSVPRVEGSISIEKEQDSQSSNIPSRSIANRNRGKSLCLSRCITKTTPTNHLHICHTSKYHTLNTHHH